MTWPSSKSFRRFFHSQGSFCLLVFELFPKGSTTNVEHSSRHEPNCAFFAHASQRVDNPDNQRMWRVSSRSRFDSDRFQWRFDETFGRGRHPSWFSGKLFIALLEIGGEVTIKKWFTSIIKYWNYLELIRNILNTGQFFFLCPTYKNETCRNIFRSVI